MAKKYDFVDLEGFGKIASNAYLQYNVPLNESIEKLAEDKGLNSEQIKTVVEAANTTTYLSLFPKATDKYLEFPVADFTKIAIKVLDPTIGLSMGGDPLGDYKSPPGKETFLQDISVLSKTAEVTGENGDIVLSDAQARGIIYKMAGAEEMYNSFMAKQEIEFGREVDKYYNMVKQAVLGGEKFTDIKQAAFAPHLDLTELRVLHEVFEEFKTNLEKDGADKYPYKADLSDSEMPKFSVVEREHPLVKQASLITEIAIAFRNNLDKKASLVGGAFLMGAGAVGGSVLTLAAAKALNEKQQARLAAQTSVLSPAANPQNMGVRSITY